MIGQISQALFFPSIENEQELADQLKKAKKQLEICIFTFTNKLLANTIFDLIQNQNIKIRIISDDIQAKMPYSLVGVLHQASNKQIEIRIDNDKVALMHNKYVIIDDHTVITGSFNWTQQAVRKNNENIVILHGKQIAKQYQTNFQDLWEKFSGNKYTVDSDIKDKGKQFKKTFKDIQKNAKYKTKQSTYLKLKKQAEKVVTKKIQKKKLVKQNNNNSNNKKQKLQLKAKNNKIKSNKKNIENKDSDSDYNPQSGEETDSDYELSIDEDEEENIIEEKVKRHPNRRLQRLDKYRKSNYVKQNKEDQQDNKQNMENDLKNENKDNGDEKNLNQNNNNKKSPKWFEIFKNISLLGVLGSFTYLNWSITTQNNCLN